MKKIGSYSLFCFIMLICTALVLTATLIYQLSSNNVFFSPFTNIILIIFALITALCICVDDPHGQIIYKIGFYILHGGLVLLIIGFIVSNITTKKYSVSILNDGKYYNSIKDGDNTVDLGFYFKLDGLHTDYYESDSDDPESRSVKQYYAYLTIGYPEKNSEQIELSVNNPAKVGGYKIYLMSVPSSGEIGATLLFKHDPAEATIYTGIVILIVGTFIMCFFGNIRLGKKKKTEDHFGSKESEDTP